MRSGAQANDMPLISVVMPTYNRAKVLGEAIRSVCEQDYGNWELLVIDDGSSDYTRTVLQNFKSEPRIRIYSQPNRGQAIARNRGIRESRGDYIAFLDSDNRWLRQKLRTQVQHLTTDASVDVLYGDIELIDMEGNVRPDRSLQERFSGEVWRPLLLDNFVNFNTSVVRSVKLRDVGGMDETVQRADDYDLWLRLAPIAKFQYVPGVVTQYRVAGKRISDNVAGRFESNISAVTRFFERNPELLSQWEIDSVLSSVHQRFARSFCNQGMRREAWSKSLAAIKLAPTQKGAWRTLAAIAVEPVRRHLRGWAR